MSLRLGDEAPDFVQESTHGTINFHEWLGDSWGILFSHPADFTPVCTTELGLTAKLKDEFDKRNVKAIALSVDPVDSHNRWIDDINETQLTQVNFPILADNDAKVANLYDMIHPNANSTLTVRSLFIIDPAKKNNERSEEHTSELQSRGQLVCRLLLEKKKKIKCDLI